MGLTEQYQGVGRVAFFLEALGEDLFPCLFQVLEVSWLPWLWPPFGNYITAIFPPIITPLALTDSLALSYIRALRITLDPLG